MPIKDKDGTIYTLRGPDPLFDTQDNWNRDKVTLLNMKWNGIIVEDKKKHSKSIKPLEGFNLSTVDEPEIDNVPIELPKIEEPPKENIAVVRKPVVISEEPAPKLPPKKVDQTTADLLDKHKVMFHCLPIIHVKHHDDLYDADTYTTGFGKKFTFAGIIVEETDLQLLFWTDRELVEKSIVFPYNKSIRCWRVEKAESKSGGFMYLGYPSDVSPDWS
jgi:hypothetical protein